MEGFNLILLRHVDREANGVAHRLAHLASTSSSDEFWVEETPDIIHDVLIEDDYKVASNAGFNVVVPDFFYGDPYNPNNTQRNMTDWLRDHGPDKGFEDAKRVIAALKKKGVSWIGAAGFCWGGKVVAELSKGYYTEAAVLLHPSRVTLDDIKEIKTPIAILAAQFDNSTAPELVKQFKEILSTNKVDNFVKIFPGVSHGWTVRYKDDNVTAVKSANEAHQDMLDWFIKYVQKT
ncbi:endo-1,3;1,4-beta-D-glucanase [Rosa chinensis]|uniref:endo-1,3;1,4-beta-D-glucanase n=1 Tax=Rosa chinensis TaxID=74649 RepID=UPI001AD8E1CA|nr:endo-1,3;1,4-beta-D-glucanase [Rosa chinensis]